MFHPSLVELATKRNLGAVAVYAAGLRVLGYPPTWFPSLIEIEKVKQHIEGLFKWD